MAYLSTALLWTITILLGYIAIGIVVAGVFFLVHPNARDNREGVVPLVFVMLVLEWPIVVANGFQ